jgi:DNA polymerase III subunit beta
MLTLSVQALKSALQKINMIAEKRSSRPILQQCLCTISGPSDNTNGAALTLTATDLELGLVTKANIEHLEGEVLGESFCVNAKYFHDMVRELNGPKVTLTRQPTEQQLTIECGTSRYKLLMASSEEYPAIRREKLPLLLNLPASQLQRMLQRVSYAMSSDETRPFLNSVFLQMPNGQSLKAVALDGHRMAIDEIELGADVFPSQGTADEALQDQPLAALAVLTTGLIIPKKAINETIKLCEMNADLIASISADKNLMALELGNDYLQFKLISRDFPQYQSIIPQQSLFSFQVNNQDLIGAVKRVKMFSSDQNNGIKLNLTKGSLRIISSNSVIGSAQEIINCQYVGEELEFSLNAKYLQESLQSFDDTQVAFEFNAVQSPLLLRSTQDSRKKAIIMPIRI